MNITDAIDTKSHTHIDDWLDEYPYKRGTEQEDYAHFMFTYWRLPAVIKGLHYKIMQSYELYCTYKDGKRYRCIGCSRLGDIWLTSDFTRSSGYEFRIYIDECTNWSKSP